MLSIHTRRLKNKQKIAVWNYCMVAKYELKRKSSLSKVKVCRYISVPSSVKRATLAHKQLSSSCTWHTANRVLCVGAPWTGLCFPYHCLDKYSCLPANAIMCLYQREIPLQRPQRLRVFPSYSRYKRRSRFVPEPFSLLLNCFFLFHSSGSVNMSFAVHLTAGMSCSRSARCVLHSELWPFQGVCPWHSPWHYWELEWISAVSLVVIFLFGRHLEVYGSCFRRHGLIDRADLGSVRLSCLFHLDILRHAPEMETKAVESLCIKTWTLGYKGDRSTWVHHSHDIASVWAVRLFWIIT